MSIFTKGLRDWRKSVGNDLRSSVSVALIGIPLAMGIALAMGAPVYAAIIPVIVGGLLVTWFSGGFISIHSTPKMLIPVIASAVITFGGNDLSAGYQVVLVAVIIAGVFQLCLGLARLGILGELIPNSVIKSLLSAVGLIILFKQYHVMLGTHTDAKTNVDLLLALWQNTINLNPLIAFIGLLSLAIMMLHPKINLPAIKAIPAVIWVIIVSVIYSLVLGIADFGVYNLFGFEYVVDDGYLIRLPESVLAGIIHPDFSAFRNPEVWSLGLTVALVTSIESILSCKGIDKIDPDKRRTNINQELTATGGGTILSALIGGLPVIPAIVASSVNVNHNGKTMMVNFYQAAIVLLLIVLLGGLLKLIPLAALAAILVHTGLKLAAPDMFVQVYRIGLEEFAIFISTLVVTFIFGMVPGIGLGILITIGFLFWHIRSSRIFLRNIFKPNTVLIIENDGTYHLSVEGFASFLNYPRLKKQLDSIPRTASVLVDLSLTRFVDHTVMEHLHHYEENFIRKGGKFSIVGLDGHDPSAPHRFANRRLLKISKMMGESGFLTSRQYRLKQLAKELNLKYTSNKIPFAPELEKFRMFRALRIDHVSNTLRTKDDDVETMIQDVAYHRGELQGRERSQATIMVFRPNTKIPVFTMDQEHIFDKLAALAGYDDIDFDSHPDFSDRYSLKSPEESGLREFFTPPVIDTLHALKAEQIESTGDKVLVLMKPRILGEGEIRSLVKKAAFLKQTLFGN